MILSLSIHPPPKDVSDIIFLSGYFWRFFFFFFFLGGDIVWKILTLTEVISIFLLLQLFQSNTARSWRGQFSILCVSLERPGNVLKFSPTSSMPCMPSSLPRVAHEYIRDCLGIASGWPCKAFHSNNQCMQTTHNDWDEIGSSRETNYINPLKTNWFCYNTHFP